MLHGFSSSLSPRADEVSLKKSLSQCVHDNSVLINFNIAVRNLIDPLDIRLIHTPHSAVKTKKPRVLSCSVTYIFF